MKTPTTPGRRPFRLKLLGYGTCYYIKRVAKLEAALARKPRTLHIELIGAGEIPADFALLLRSALLSRSPRTRLITHARSSLQNGAVLVWLLGDTRLIRDDARVFFRRAKLDEDDEPELQPAWADEPKYCDSYSEIEPEEGDHAACWRSSTNTCPCANSSAGSSKCPCSANSASWNTSKWTTSSPPHSQRRRNLRNAR